MVCYLWEHPKQVCMSYMEHAALSLRLAVLFGVASVTAVVHAILPDLFVTGSSDAVRTAHRLKKGKLLRLCS